MRLRHALGSAVLVIAAGSFAAAAGQVRSREDAPTTSTAQPRTSPPTTAATAPAAPAQPPASTPAPAAQPRPAPSGGASTGTSAGGTQDGVARPRTGRPAAGTAVPRTSVPVREPRVTYVVPGYGYGGGFWPWGYGGLGFGSYYAFDPFYAGAAPIYTSSPFNGAIRLKVKPRQAQVYADGYYVGVVDDFDGIFQSLHLDPGVHHLELRASGFEPLTIDVQIQPDHTIKYEGAMRPVGQ